MLPGKMWTDTPYDDTFYPRTFTGDITRLSRRGRLALTFRSITTRPRRRSFTCVNTRLYFLCLQVFQFLFSFFLSYQRRIVAVYISFRSLVLFYFFIYLSHSFYFPQLASNLNEIHHHTIVPRSIFKSILRAWARGAWRRKWSTKMINVNSHLKRYISAFKYEKRIFSIDSWTQFKTSYHIWCGRQVLAMFTEKLAGEKEGTYP